MTRTTDIGTGIRERRRARGLSLQDLADAVGRDRSTISRYERGLIDVPLSELMRIADALGTSVSNLVRVRAA
jgi:transcriptional regulator with XRE-family HTH domain